MSAAVEELNYCTRNYIEIAMERVKSKLPCTWRRPFLCPVHHSHNNRSLFHFGWFTPKSLNSWSPSWKCSHFWFHIRSQEERWRLAGGLCTTVLYFEPNTSTVWAAHTPPPSCHPRNPILLPNKSDASDKQTCFAWTTENIRKITTHPTLPSNL